MPASSLDPRAARTLNLDRRHLTTKQRREVVAALWQEEHSLRAIAGVVGVSQEQVRQDLAGVTRVTPARVTGRDGKSYPAKRPAAERVAQIQALADEGHTARLPRRAERQAAAGGRRRSERARCLPGPLVRCVW